MSLIGSNLSSTGAMPSSPVRSFRLISSICSCTEMKRVKKKKRNEANLDIRPFYINEAFVIMGKTLFGKNKFVCLSICLSDQTATTQQQ